MTEDCCVAVAQGGGLVQLHPDAGDQVLNRMGACCLVFPLQPCFAAKEMAIMMEELQSYKWGMPQLAAQPQLINSGKVILLELSTVLGQQQVLWGYRDEEGAGQWQESGDGEGGWGERGWRENQKCRCAFCLHSHLHAMIVMSAGWAPVCTEYCESQSVL